MDNWTAPKYNIIQHTIYSSVVAKNLHLHSSVEKGGQNKKSGWIFCVRQVYFYYQSWKDTEAFYLKYNPTQGCFLRGQLIRLNPI